MSTVEPSSLPVHDAAPLFAALGDGTRLELLFRLCEDGPQSVARLASQAEVTRQALSKHLAVLSEAGLVRSSRQGRERVFELDPRRIDDAHRYLERISRQWDQALDRLRAFVDGDA